MFPLGAMAVLALGISGMPRYIFNAVEVYAVGQNLFCHTDFVFCQSAPIGKNHILKNDRGYKDFQAV